MTTREKVAKLKEDLKKRKAMLRGEFVGEEEDDLAKPNLDQSIQIDTTL